MKPAVLVRWTESEAGWGSRPDGASLHPSQTDVDSFIKRHWDEEHKRNPSGEVPNEYSRPDSNTGTLVLVDKALYVKMSKTRDGLRLWEEEFRRLVTEDKILFNLKTKPQTPIRNKKTKTRKEPPKSPQNDIEYVGIVERNAWEGQTFGYYWLRTPEAENTLRRFVERYTQEGETSIRFEVASHGVLSELARMGGNSYKKRVSVYKAPANWAEFAEQLAPENEDIVSTTRHPFYKGRGIPKELKDPQWTP